jgi:NAD(P)H dehydrogenase (quinone)
MRFMSQTLLVTGAAGKLGQSVIAHLLGTQKIPAARIVAATRDPGKLASLAAKGVGVRKADFDDSASLGAALAGVDRMLLISTDALDRPGRRLAQHQAAIAAAKKAGVKHVVYTSMPNPDGSLVTFAPDHLGTEQALAASGLGWTILRNSWYMENLLMSLPGALAAGKWLTSTGNGKIAHVSRDDCARAAAAALASDSTANACYDITGPQKLTTAEIAALASEVFAKPLEVVQITDEEISENLQAHGVPAVFVPTLVSFEANTRAGKFDLLSNAVEKLTGKPPQRLRDFLMANKAGPNQY